MLKICNKNNLNIYQRKNQHRKPIDPGTLQCDPPSNSDGQVCFELVHLVVFSDCKLMVRQQPHTTAHRQWRKKLHILGFDGHMSFELLIQFCLRSFGMRRSRKDWYWAKVQGIKAMAGIQLEAKELLLRVAPSQSNQLPDSLLLAEVWQDHGVSKDKAMCSWWWVGEKKTEINKFYFVSKKKDAARFHSSSGKGGKYAKIAKKKNEKDCPENGLSGFLKELSWGSKQLGGSANEVMTDGISRAWHNSPIWWSCPALHKC